MIALECQELEFFLALLLVYLGALRDTLLCSLDASLKLNDLVLLAGALILLSLDDGLEVSLAMLRLLLLAHGEGDGALIERLVGLPRHFDVVADAEKKESALRLVKRYLSDQLIETLTEELLANGADTS